MELTNREKLEIATASLKAAARAEYKHRLEGDYEKADEAKFKAGTYEAEIRRLKAEA